MGYQRSNFKNLYLISNDGIVDTSNTLCVDHNIDYITHIVFRVFGAIVLLHQLVLVILTCRSLVH